MPAASYRQRGCAAALHHGADPAAEAIPRLSRDARQAEGHRCDRGRDTGSHACSHRARGMDLNKHVYVQKPLCWSVEEARALAKKAKEKPRVITQMGNQGHSSDGSRTGYEYIRGGSIADVREVQVWTNRPLGFWP